MQEDRGNQDHQNQEAASTPLKKASLSQALSSHSKLKLSKAAESFNKEFKTVQIPSDAPETSKYYWDPGNLFQSQFLQSQSNAILATLASDPATISASPLKSRPAGAATQTTPSKPRPAEQVLDATWCKRERQRLADNLVSPVSKPRAVAGDMSTAKLNRTALAEETADGREGENNLGAATNAGDDNETERLGKRNQLYLPVPRFFAAGRAAQPRDKELVSETLTQLLPEITGLINHSVILSKQELLQKKSMQNASQAPEKILDTQGARFFSKFGAELCTVIGILVDKRMSRKGDTEHN